MRILYNFVISVALIVSAISVANAQVKIGETLTGDFDILGDQYQQEVVVQDDGAEFLRVHFKRLVLKPGAYITVSNANGEEVYRYPETPRTKRTVTRRLWSNIVEGSKAIVQLHSDALPGNVVRINQYVFGFSPIELESTCGSADDSREAICFRDSHPQHYRQSWGTARIVTTKSNGTFTCTGWLVGPRNDTMITNNHCVANQTELNNSQIRFRERRESCSRSSRVLDVVTTRGNRLLETNGRSDITLFTIRNPERARGATRLQLTNRAPRVGDLVYIPQHPNGNPRRIAIEDEGRTCRIRSVSGKDVRYTCDTQGGSSGSPVILANSHEVIALHNAGGCFASGGSNHGNSVRSFFSLVRGHLGL